MPASCLLRKIQNGMLRTLRRALAAADALRRINHCHIVHDMDRIMLAGSLTHPACNAGGLADCHRCLAKILVGALNENLLRNRLQ